MPVVFDRSTLERRHQDVEEVEDETTDEYGPYGHFVPPPRADAQEKDADGELERHGRYDVCKFTGPAHLGICVTCQQGYLMSQTNSFPWDGIPRVLWGYPPRVQYWCVYRHHSLYSA